MINDEFDLLGVIYLVCFFIIIFDVFFLGFNMYIFILVYLFQILITIFLGKRILRMAIKEIEKNDGGKND